jgi:hypothetical protein
MIPAVDHYRDAAFDQRHRAYGEVLQSHAAPLAIASSSALVGRQNSTAVRALTLGDSDRGKLRTVEALQHHRMAAAVDDRDNDVPVVLLGLRFDRGHRLLGQVERHWRAIVTNTFVNRHVFLPQGPIVLSRGR